MKFNTTTVEISTRVKQGSGEIVTKLTLTECDVPNDVIQSALISGQSPRVRIQNKWRSDGIPKEAKMTWAEYVTPGKQPRILVPETPEQIANRAKQDPEFLKAVLEQLGMEVAEEQPEEQAEQSE